MQQPISNRTPLQPCAPQAQTGAVLGAIAKRTPSPSSFAPSPSPPPLKAEAEVASSSPPILPPAKLQRIEYEGRGSDLATFGIDSAAPAVAASAPSNPWAHLTAASAAKWKNEQQDVKPPRQQQQQRPRERACLIPPWPALDAATPPPFRTAFDMLQDEQPVLSLGDEYLDAPLQGGLREGLTELVGEAACGKTQLAMQLLLQCQLPKSKGGLNGSALYLAIEELPISRLRSLADSFKQRHPDITHDVFAKIYIKSIATPSDLSSVLHGPSLRLSLERGDIKLIVLDSVAALFRAEQVGRDDTMDFSARAQELLSMAGQLKLLSATFHVPVLVVNQVSDFFAGADSNSGSAMAVEHTKHSYLHHWSMLSSGHRVVPALGLTWANCVNTRIFLTRKHEFVQASFAPMRPMGATTTVGDVAPYNPLVNMFTPRFAGVAAPNGMHSQSQLAQLPHTGGMQPMPPLAAPTTKMRRFLHVQFAPHLPQATAEFLIESGGIRGTSNLDELRAMITPPPQLPAMRPADGGSPQVQSSPPASAGAPQLQPFFHHVAPAGSPTAAPTSVSSVSFMRNMFTPSGFVSSSNGSTAVASNDGDNGVASSSTSQAPSSFFDESDEVGRTEEEERQELLMLEQAEAALRQRQEELSRQPVAATADIIMSPPQQQPVRASPQQQAQGRAQPRPSPPPQPRLSPPPQPNIWQRSSLPAPLPR